MGKPQDLILHHTGEVDWCENAITHCDLLGWMMDECYVFTCS